jgi:hypothetical protein
MHITDCLLPGSMSSVLSFYHFDKPFSSSSKQVHPCGSYKLPGLTTDMTTNDD